MKIRLTIISVITCVLIATATVFAMGSTKRTHNQPTDQALLFQKNALEKQGRSFEKSGDFAMAKIKYRDAMKLDVLIYGSDRGRAMAFLAEVYQKENQFEEADKLLIQLLEMHPTHEHYKEWRKELLALIEYSKSGDDAVIRNQIRAYKAMHETDLPPSRYNFSSIHYVTRILALHDTIGDYDAGMAFIDEILAYLLMRKTEFIQVHSSAEAIALSKKVDTIQDKKNVRGYQIFAEYFKVREAFGQDKAEGKKGSMKEGKPGRATLALIQSDYFPW